MDFVALLVAVVAVVVLLPYILFRGKDAPFVPMEAAVVKRVMEIANVGPGDTFYDLGSGDGRLVIAAAMRGAKAVGVEISPSRVWYSRVLIFILRLGAKAEIFHGDLFKTDLREATVVHLYLLPKTNEELKEKLLNELKKDVRLVTVGFPISGFKLAKEDERGTIYGPIRLYKVPET